MNQRAKEYASTILAFLSPCAYAASFWLAYKSGCAGDPKTGEGNAVVALQIESQAIMLLFLAGILMSLAYVFGGKGQVIIRLLSGVFVACLFFVPGFFAVGYMQGVGVQSCG